MKNENTYFTSILSIDTENGCKSKSSCAVNSKSSNHKQNDWLNDLLELHYFAYNSCNSLTIYSYNYWTSQRKLIIATKENNIKEIFFEITLLNSNDHKLLSNSNSSSHERNVLLPNSGILRWFYFLFYYSCRNYFLTSFQRRIPT